MLRRAFPTSVQEQLQIKLGRAGMNRRILEQATPKLEQFGIELVDFRIKRINYVEEVLRKVYERMIAERKQISEKFRSEGKGESKKIQGDQEKELRGFSPRRTAKSKRSRVRPTARPRASVPRPSAATPSFIRLS